MKYKDIIYRTQKAVFFLIKNERKIWIPNFVFNFARQGKVLQVDKEFCIKNSIEYSDIIHIPSKITPQFNQKILNELQYEC